ncbi:MAG: type II secretion system minor pseudopilin GspK [Thermodesulfovibrionales bacterium]|nr:type II secretion system minor pseudopilin GspK [Thermodesulfovibrionales bacterium]
MDGGGMALVLVLMVIAIITALVVEFAYGVYINTSSLANWQAGQRLSLASRSAVRLAAKTIAEKAEGRKYTYPGFIELSYENPLEAGGAVLIRAEDENSKFNINTVIYPNGKLNKEAYDSLMRLLGALELDPGIAGRVADWIDPDSEPRLTDSEDEAKNAPLNSVDEILLIRSIDREAYAKLQPYITIYGSGAININGADVLVLMSLSEGIDREMAGRVVGYRDVTRFESPGEISKVAGFEGDLGIYLMGKITVKGSVFRIISTAVSGDIKRTIEAVVDLGEVVKYWKET